MRTQKGLVSVELITVTIMIAIITIIVSGSIDYNKSQCKDFENYPVSQIPVRCINYFNK